MMGQFEQLDQMLTAQEGMLRTSQVALRSAVFFRHSQLF